VYYRVCVFGWVGRYQKSKISIINEKEMKFLIYQNRDVLFWEYFDPLYTLYTWYIWKNSLFLFQLYNYGRKPLDCPPDELYCHFRQPEKLLKEIDVVHVNMYGNCAYIIILGVVVHLITYSFIYKRVNKRWSIGEMYISGQKNDCFCVEHRGSLGCWW